MPHMSKEVQLTYRLSRAYADLSEELKEKASIQHRLDMSVFTINKAMNWINDEALKGIIRGNLEHHILKNTEDSHEE